jgi:predicted transposase/invertase (TIGR01784 family)
MSSTFINPFTDFGFKKIFGEEASKPHLIDFLNALLPPFAQIADLSFKNLEQLPRSEDDRKAVYDIYCRGQSGELTLRIERCFTQPFPFKTKPSKANGIIA